MSHRCSPVKYCALCLAVVLAFLTGNNESIADVSFVGCYGAVSESAIGESTFYIVNTTLGKCIDQCRVHDARYAAIDISSSVCHCGPDIPYESNKFDEAMCDSACPDNAITSCGGNGVNSVYDVNDAKTTVYRDGASMLVGTSDSVLMFNTSRKFAYGTLRKSKSHIYTVDYHWEKQLAFSIDTSGKMFRSSLIRPSENHTNISSVQMHTMARCKGFAVDWVHDRIFWAHCEDDFYDYKVVPSRAPVMSIRTINLEGTDEKTLVTQNTNIVVRRMAVDPYAGKLFWIAGCNSVDACDVDGNNAHTVYQKDAPEVGRPPSVMREIFLDLTSRRIFYVADTGRLALSSMDYAGGDRKDHWSNVDELRYVYGLGVVNGIVFWVNSVIMRSDVLYQAPLSDPSKLEVVRAIASVWHMRVVHPSLQSDPCAVPDCKQECDHHQSTACQCPTHCGLSKKGFEAQQLPTSNAANRDLVKSRTNHKNTSNIGIFVPEDIFSENSQRIVADLNLQTSPNDTAANSHVDAKEPNLSLLDTTSRKMLYGELDGISVSSLNHTKRLPFLLKSTNASIISVDYHWKKTMIFFSTLEVIFRQVVVGQTVLSGPEPLIWRGLWRPMLAVDWVHDRLYWMNSHYQTIESADLKGGDRKLLIDNIRPFQYPNNIAVDPYEQLIFFVSNLTVFTCHLDGANVKRFRLENNDPGILKNGVRSLALDRKNKRLYTSRKHQDVKEPNATRSYITSVNYDAGSDKTVTSNGFNDIYSLDVLYNTLVFADFGTNQRDTVYQIINVSGIEVQNVTTHFVTNNKTSELFSVRLFHPCVQRPADDPQCKQ